MNKSSAFPTTTLQILLADGHRMILDMFSMYLNSAAGMQVTTAASLEGALQRIKQDGPFDVVLLDLHMPGMNGVIGLKRALRLNEGKPVAIITGQATPRMQEEIMNTGSAGIVLKTTPIRSLSNAIRFIHAGERYLPMKQLRDGTESVRLANSERLSRKEAQVLNYLAEGKPNKEIANELLLAEPTVKMRVTSICRKLGAQNRTQAAIMARDMGLV
ncbi:MAG: response regulator transcription factor [Pseudorhodobacter sp.]